MENARLNYICIVRDKKIILADYSEKDLKYASLIPDILPNITLEKREKMSLRQSLIFVDSTDRLSFIVYTSDNYPIRLGFDILSKLKQTFTAKFTKEQQENAIAFGLNKHFAKELKENFQFYNSSKCDNLLTLKQNVNELKNVIEVDLDLLINRGESLAVLVDRTASMKEVSTNMYKESKKVHSHMWWQNKKITFAIIIIIAVAIWLLTSFICGFDYSKC